MITKCRRTCFGCPTFRGVTLVELMVVIVIISTLSAMVLPSFKNVMSERKTNVAALEVKSFLEAARARAIARGRSVSVIFERLSSRSDGLGIDPANAVTLTNPPRSISAYNPAGGAISENANFPGSDAFTNYSQYNTCVRMTMAETLKPSEHQLVPTIVSIANGFQQVTITSTDQRLGVELADGNEIEFISANGMGNRFVIHKVFSAVSPYSFAIFNQGSATQPFGVNLTDINIAANSQIPIRPFVDLSTTSSIRTYPKPMPIASMTNELPRGTCIDLSISGLASDEPFANYLGNEFTNCQREFASDWIMPVVRGGPPTPQQLRPVQITFSSSGSLDSIITNAPQVNNFPANPRIYNSRRIDPNQDVFLFVGRTDQVVLPFDSTANSLTAFGIAQRVDEGAKPNMLDPTCYWVRISAVNGSIAAAPTQSYHVEMDVEESRTAPADADTLGEMLTESRALTFQGELSSQ